MSEKQDLAALSTVTAAPLGASGSSAARVGEARERRVAARAEASRFRERLEAGRGFININIKALFDIRDIRTLLEEPSGKQGRSKFRPLTGKTAI
jgi:hypothetical protein